MKRAKGALRKLVSSTLRDEAFDIEVVIQIGFHLTGISRLFDSVRHLKQQRAFLLGTAAGGSNRNQLFKNPPRVQDVHLGFDRNLRHHDSCAAYDSYQAIQSHSRHRLTYWRTTDLNQFAQ